MNSIIGISRTRDLIKYKNSLCTNVVFDASRAGAVGILSASVERNAIAGGSNLSRPRMFAGYVISS